MLLMKGWGNLYQYVHTIYVRSFEKLCKLQPYLSEKIALVIWIDPLIPRFRPQFSKQSHG